MNTEQISRWLTLGANFGVLVGIFLLAAELRQTNNIARAEVRNSLTQSVYTLLQMQREPRQIAALERSMEKWELLSFEEQILLSSVASAVFRHFENAYYQHSFGVYSADQFAAETSQLDASLATPFLADYWTTQSDSHGGEFQDFVEQRNTQPALPK